MPSFRFNFVRSPCRMPLLVNTLVASFLKFISRSDSLVFYDVLMQNKFDYERIVDNLSRCAIKANPTKENIRNLIIKAAKIELISKPRATFRSFKYFRNFFKNFWSPQIQKCYSIWLLLYQATSMKKRHNRLTAIQMKVISNF